jgi:adenylate cyclase
MDVRAIHTTDLDGWVGDPDSAPFQELLRALDAMITRHGADLPGTARAAPVPSAMGASARVAIAVLPFLNMSGDAEQEYFSDGITEDIITDLGKVSALSVISRNSVFVYKGKPVDVTRVARELKVSHVLEGSVRKAGGRVRISAQLIDGTGNNQVWAERYDRDSSDIFALQDEISEAIVKALKLRLLPEEKKAIERRGTDNAEAHNLYLMARQTYVTAQEWDPRSSQAIVRLCARATAIDPAYAQAWALMAIGYGKLRYAEAAGPTDLGMEAAERALALDPDLAEAHAIKALLLTMDGDAEAAATEVAIALDLDPDSYEVNRSAGRLCYQLDRHREAVGFFEKTTALMETDINSPSMLISSYTALGDDAAMRRVAQLTLERSEQVLRHDPNNVVVTGDSAYALAALGEGERAKARMNRALLIDPDNFNMRYNFVCALSRHLGDKEGALEMFGPAFDLITAPFLSWVRSDPDLDLVRDDPRFEAMVAAAEAKFAAEAGTGRVETRQGPV